MPGNKIGKLHGKVFDKFGMEKEKATISEIMYTPNSRFNLFSMTKRMQDGWILGGNKESMWLTKGDQKLIFDIKINTSKGALFCIYFKRDCEMAATAKNCGKKISKNLAHELTVHINGEESKKTIEYLGYDLSRGGMKLCEACAEAKAKMKNLPTRVQTVDKVVRPRVIPARPNDLIRL